MVRFETLFILLLLGVGCIYVTIHIHAGLDAPNPSLRGGEAYQTDELNKTLVALNSALKQMLVEASKNKMRITDQEVANVAKQLATAKIVKVPAAEPKPAVSMAKEVQNTNTHSITSVTGKRAVVFTMDSISACKRALALSFLNICPYIYVWRVCTMFR
jgi:hypothetical protein